MQILEFTFLLLIIIVIYVYIGYPIICLVMCKFNSLGINKNNNLELPFVTIIISAYNEEDVIDKKMRNTLNLSYPQERLEIIVASDGSTDETTEIVSKYNDNNIIILNFKENRGKTITQNNAVRYATGDIIVFSDANAMYEIDAIKKLVRNFNDPLVGCVCGELRYVNKNNSAGQGEGFYWRYEKFLKKMESNLGNCLGANGSIYALKRNLYVPLSQDIISDFIEPLQIVAQGYRTVYEEEAISYEEPSENYKDELRRKIRIITRSYRGLLSVKNLLNPFKYRFLAISLLSHKLLRWLSGFVLLLIFFTNIPLAIINGGLYLLVLGIQIVFYCLAILGLVLELNWKPLIFPAYFCMVNYSSIMGILRYYMGDRAVSWQPIRK